MYQYGYLQLSNFDRYLIHANQIAAQQNMFCMNIARGNEFYGQAFGLGMRNEPVSIQGPYKSDAMNAKLAAAKKWLNNR